MYNSFVSFYSTYMAIIRREGSGSCIVLEDNKHVIVFRIDMTGVNNPVILHESYYTENIRSRFSEMVTVLLSCTADYKYFQTETAPVYVRNKYITDETHEEIVENVRYNIDLLVKAGVMQVIDVSETSSNEAPVQEG